MANTQRAWYSGMATTEDWWAVWLGLFFFGLGLLTLAGVDLVGWVAYPKQWVWNMPDGAIPKKIGTPGTSFNSLGAGYKSLGPIASILVTYAVLTIATCVGAFFQKWDMKKFFFGWTIIFFLTYLVWFIGHNAFFAASTVDLKKSHFPEMFSLSLGGGASFILALIVGLIIGNFFKPLANFLSTAAKPEWYIKTAIVFLGVKVGYLPIKAVTAGAKLSGKGGEILGQQMAHLTLELFVAGAAATIVAYLIFWPGVYLISRKIFNLPRKTAAVLGSAISICGVSAAVATGGAVRAKPVVSIMVSALVVVYAVIELVVLPGVFTHVWPGTKDPIVAGAAMGMAVKTDGADAAAGELLDEFMRNKVQEESNGQIQWMEGIITTSAVMTKIWIDMFIGLWAFVLAMVWVYKIEKHEGDRVPFSEVWFRFPKFVLGYFAAWLIYLGIFFGPGQAGAGDGMDVLKAAKPGAVAVEKGLRKLFFMLTFVSLGIITDFKRLAEAQFGKMVWVYFISLTFFIIPVAIIVAYLFHHGMEIPNMAAISGAVIN